MKPTDEMIDSMAKVIGFAGRERMDRSEDAEEFWAYTGDQTRAVLRKQAAAVLALSASPDGPFEMRHEEGGYVEFLNEDVPTVVREIDGRVAILTTLDQPRKVVGYRVYDPGSSPSEVFGSALPAGVVKPLEAVRSAGLKARDELLERMADGGTVDNDLADYMERIVDACVNSARIMSAIEPAGVGVETASPYDAICAAVDEVVGRAEIEWSYREDSHRYPRDFWHAQISYGSFDSGWRRYGEQEKYNLPDDVKAKAEEELRAELRSHLLSPFAALKGDEQ